jgi:hypothetical protein
MLRHAFAPLLSLALTAPLFTGCFDNRFVDDDNQPGDVSFDWSFDGETDCAAAGVDELDISVLEDGVVVLTDTASCVGRGLTVRDLAPGLHSFDVRAFPRNSDIADFAANFDVDVIGGQNTDIGVVEFAGLRPGSVSFLWSFAGETDCARAGVSEVDLVVLRNGQEAFKTTASCVGGGLTIPNLDPGLVTLNMSAFARDNSTALFLAEVDVTVPSNRDFDLGLVEFSPVDAQTSSRPGALALFWQFAFPTSDSQNQNCGDAGVSEVDVFVRPRAAGVQGFEDTLPCGNEGVRVLDLAPGTYDVQLTGYGTYQSAPIALYDTGSFAVTIRADEETQLGDVTLAQINESFVDVEATWTFGSGTCASLGINTIEVSVKPAAGGNAVATTAVDCAAAAVLFQTLLPGSYIVEAVGVAVDNSTHRGVQTIDAAPNLTTTASLQLVELN